MGAGASKFAVETVAGVATFVVDTLVDTWTDAFSVATFSAAMHGMAIKTHRVTIIMVHLRLNPSKKKYITLASFKSRLLSFAGSPRFISTGILF